MPQIKKVIMDHASREKLSLEELASTLDYNIAEFNKKLDSGSFTEKEMKDIKALLNIEDSSLKTRKYAVELEGDEGKIMASMKEVFAGQLQDYCGKHAIGQPEFGEAMFTNRNSIKGWFNKSVFPGFERFFEAQAVMHEGHEKIKSRGKTYLEEKRNEMLKRFMDHFAQTIKRYCSEKGIYSTDFAEKIGISSSTIYTHRSWSPEEELPSYKTYIKIMYAINRDKPDCTDIILWPMFYTENLEKASAPQQEKPSEDTTKTASRSLDELLKNYSTMSDADKAEFIKQTITILGKSLDYFAKSPQARDVLRGACKSNLQELGEILMHSRQILRNEEAYQEHIKMNPGLYGKNGGK